MGLTIKALDAFKPIQDVEGAGCEMVRGVARLLIKSRPTIVSVGNAAAEVYCKVMDKGAVGGIGTIAALEAERMQRKLVSTRGGLANAFAQYVDKPIVVLTLSNSQTVLECLNKVQGKLAQVFIAVSDPGHDGERLSRELSDLGIRNLLIPDMAIGSIMPKVNYVLLGADAVLSDGSVVNKLGSNTVAKIAYLEGRQVFFLAQTIKVHPAQEGVTIESDSGDQGEGYQPKFDITPYGYVQRLLCEDGELDLDKIRMLSERYRDLRQRVKPARKTG